MDEAVRREVVLPVDRDTAWEEVAGLTGWVADEVEIDLWPGGEGIFRWADGEERRALVEEVEPGRRLAFSWTGEDGEPSLVELTLDDAPDGATRLVVLEIPLVGLHAVSTAPAAGGQRRGPAMVAGCA
ncbi:MAG TPA: SRPBCC domain-containing protein [Solirubrobacteraceae bacterium]|nr:SRPBCC domain-containing protein [Solirubrobacteraceae bacterium]